MQVVHSWHPVLQRFAKHRLLFLEIDLPVAPLHTPDIIPHINDQPLAVGVGLFTQEKIALVHAVN